jgi:hypothetical protein
MVTATPWWTLIAEIGGWALAAAGLALLLWALFGDRSRGRRRCPGCWYDMSGVPGRMASAARGGEQFTCPECGRVAKSVRELQRTHRRRFAAALATLVFVVAYGIGVAPRVATEGPVGIAPTLGLIATVRLVPCASEEPALVIPLPPNRRDYRTLEARLNAGSVPGWQRRLAAWAAAGRAERDLRLSPPRLSCGLEELLRAATRDKGHVEYTRLAAPLAAIWLEMPARCQVGSPIYARVQCEGLGYQNALAEFRTPWCRAPITTEVQTPAGQYSMMMAADMLYEPPVVCLGVPDRPADAVDVDVLIRRRDWGRPDEDAPITAHRRLRVPVRIAAAGQAPLQAVEGNLALCWAGAPWIATDVYRTAKFQLRNFTPTFPGRAGVTIGGRVEVLHGDEVRLVGELCMVDGVPRGLDAQSRWMLALLDASTELRPVQAPAPVSATPSEWRLRFTGDENIARQHIEATTYWRGQAEFLIHPDAALLPVWDFHAGEP